MTETIDAGRAAFEDTLHKFAKKAATARTLRTGDIAFRVGAVDGKAELVLASDGGGVRVVPAAGRTGTPLVEVLGDAEAVRKVLAGEVEGRKQFLAGGIRVRGDLRYLSNLAIELGVLAKPL
jgi:SCP-2 sterol transfer family protein